MKKILSKIPELFGRFFKLIEENKQTNVIHSIGKDDKNQTVIFLAPIGSNKMAEMKPHQIIQEPCIKKQLQPSDLKLIESLLISEGDIFIESKEYKGDEEIFNLKSVLIDESWTLTESEIKNNKTIFNRLNKRYFVTQLKPQPVRID